jgi:hypothetical protein
MNKLLLLAAITLAVSHVSANAAEQAATPTPAHRTPGCDERERHQLDFWIGDWDTFEAEEAPVQSEARAHVDAILAGCAVQELSEQTDGLIGDSFLSYDAITKKWQQTWLTNFGAFMFLSGTFNDGVLTLEGSSHTKTKDVPYRITWRSEKGGVRETGTMSNDGGRTWVPAFDVLFLKHKT